MAKRKRQVPQPPPRPLHYLKEWREFRQMTQEKLAELVGTDKSVISLKETGNRGLGDKWARRFAPHLQTTPGWIIDHDPNDLPTDILEIWNDIPDEAKPQAAAVLRTFARNKGTPNK